VDEVAWCNGHLYSVLVSGRAPSRARAAVSGSDYIFSGFFQSINQIYIQSLHDA